MKPSGIGGQAVLEGIMMRNKEQYAVAVRKTNQEIEVCTKTHQGVGQYSFAKLPFIRGIFNFVDSMYLGMSSLMYSAEFFDEDETEEGEEQKDTLGDQMVMTGTLVVSILFALGVFIALPSLLSDLLRKLFEIESHVALSFMEGGIRLLIFVAYIFLISRMKDIQRTFMYHGAEHKCINCIEHGLELNVENVMKSSRLHRRCGTSFLFLVMFISIFIFILIPIQQPVVKVVVRLLCVPLIAGISYEVLRLAGKSDHVLVRMISMPGMALQKMTTREPDASQVEVAIAAVEAVFDWKAFLAEDENDAQCSHCS